MRQIEIHGNDINKSMSQSQRHYEEIRFAECLVRFSSEPFIFPSIWGVSKGFWTESIKKYTLKTINTRSRSNTNGYGCKTH